jgi:thymidylate synthase (FAD)
MLDYNMKDKLPVHKYGYVALLDKMGTDEDIVDAARISYDRKGRTADRALIRYLLRHRHTSPFEMAVLKFEVSMPIFVARQWVRHRTASINEVSARYTQLPDEMFVSEVFSTQSTDNKQGRGGIVEIDNAWLQSLVSSANLESYSIYEEMLRCGVAREIARGVLPLNIYTKFVWKMDLHNLMHFLHLRLDSHAQEEIRDYAQIIERLVALYYPITYEAFVDYMKESYTCSRMEKEVLREIIYMFVDANDGDLSIDNIYKQAGMTDREIIEFEKAFVK